MTSQSGATSIWIVVLNWNNAGDTVDCLASIADANDPAIGGVVVCDNGSTDDSVATIRSWAQAYAGSFVDGAALGTGDGWTDSSVPLVPGQPGVSGRPPIVLLQTGGNLGFAGGNNVGIGFVQRHAEYAGILLLNNDALITPGAVSAMAKRLVLRPDVGLCGAVVVYDADRSTVQALGGSSFQPWLARAKHIGAHSASAAPVLPTDVVEARLDYILGAAMLVSRPCLEAIGSLYDGYFLYYEEIDWAVRAKRAGFALGYAADALIYHKEGRTIGSSSNRSQRSLLSEHYLFSSRSRFTWRFYPWFLPSVIAIGLLRVLRSLLDREPRRALVQLRGMFGLPRGG